mgnify:FL=1
MKRKELEEFKKRWEENLGGLGEMLNSPWFAVSIKYDEAEKNKCCIKLGQYVLRYWAQLHGVDLSPYGDKEITTDEFKQAVTKAQTEIFTSLLLAIRNLAYETNPCNLDIVQVFHLLVMVQSFFLSKILHLLMCL